MDTFQKDLQYRKFSAYGFLKNLRFFEAFFILFLLEKELSFAQIGFLYAFREVIINLLEVPSGIFADTFGRRRSLAGSFLFYIGSFFLFYQAESLLILTVAFALYGVGEAFRTGTHKGMIMDYLAAKGWQQHKVAYYGHTRSWSQRGSAISALAAGIILFYEGTYASIFLYACVPYVLNLLLILSYPVDLDRTEGQTKKRSFAQAFIGFWKSVGQLQVLAAISNAALHSAYLKALKDYIQPMLKQMVLALPIMLAYGEDKKAGLFIGLAYFVIYFLSAFASVLSGQWFGKGKNDGPATFITLFIGLGFGVLCGLFFHFEFWVLAVICFVMVFLVENLRKPLMTGFVAEQVPNAVLTSVLSAQSLFKTLMTAAITITFGIVADLEGIGWALVAVSSGLLLLALLSLLQGLWNKI